MPSSCRSILTTAVVSVGLSLLLSHPPALAAGSDMQTALWPLVPRPEVVAGFDPPAENWNAGHRGVDLRGTPGQRVRAAKSGWISYAGRLAGRGVVVVTHGDTRTTYQPVASTVRVGDRVTAGQKLGVLHPFGSHCWPRTCLHWGLIRGETYLDPLTLVGAGPVRLLPFHRNLGQFFAATAVAEFVVTPWMPPVRPGGELAGRPAAVGLW